MILKSALDEWVWSDLRWPNNSTATRKTQIHLTQCNLSLSCSSKCKHFLPVRDMITDGKVILVSSLANADNQQTDLADFLWLKICTVAQSVPVIPLPFLLFCLLFIRSLPHLLSHDPPSLFIPFVIPLFFSPPISLSVYQTHIHAFSFQSSFHLALFFFFLQSQHSTSSYNYSPLKMD